MQGPQAQAVRNGQNVACKGDCGASAASGGCEQSFCEEALHCRLSEERSSLRKSGKKKVASSARGLPAFIAPQLCTLVDRPPSDGDWVHEIKFDGYRIQMRVEQGNVT